MSDNEAKEAKEVAERMHDVVQRAEERGVNLLSLRLHWLEQNVMGHLSEEQRTEYEMGFLALAENLLDQVEPQTKQPKLAVVTQMPGQQGLDLGA